MGYLAPAGLAACLPPEYVGKVRLERGFNRPSGLDALSRVELVVESSAAGTVWLNDVCLGEWAGGACRFAASESLRTHNRIRVDLVIDASGAMHQPNCEVRLEILNGTGSGSSSE